MPELDAGSAEPWPTGEVRSVRGQDVYVAVVRLDEGWFAFADACSHHECPLLDGFVGDVTIECSCHGSIFDLRTGSVVRGPARAPIPVFGVEVRDGRVVIDTVPRDGIVVHLD
jgi:3-phenylpropionate/trans-cinnamate dioxygenase ferredoxin component